jgi:hypothetical protein
VLLSQTNGSGMAEIVPSPALAPAPYRSLDHDRLHQIAQDLAVGLAQGTAQELATRSAPPEVLELSWRPVTPATRPFKAPVVTPGEAPDDESGYVVVEGETIIVTVRLSPNCDSATIQVPGSDELRPYREDELIHFTATTTGSIEVTAHNVLNPTVSRLSIPVRVIHLPEVSPYTFAGINVQALTGADIVELAQSLDLVTQEVQKLYVSGMAREVLSVTEATQMVGRRLAEDTAELYRGLGGLTVEATALSRPEGSAAWSRPALTGALSRPDWSGFSAPSRFWPIAEDIILPVPRPWPIHDDTIPGGEA